MPPGKGERRQVMAIFQKEGKTYAVPIGFEADEQYKIYSDEMFYIEDPHDLYKHWPPEVWQAVEQHQVNPGMNEMQADFAIGMGVPDGGRALRSKRRCAIPMAGSRWWSSIKTAKRPRSSLDRRASKRMLVRESRSMLVKPATGITAVECGLCYHAGQSFELPGGAS